MNNGLLTSLGLGNVDLGLLIIISLGINVILLILLIIAFVKIGKFTSKYKIFMQGKNASSLEKDIMALYEDNRFIKNEIENNRKEIIRILEKQKANYQKLGVVKYDAFKELGGKLSYSIALLDENNDGLILNSVHSSGGCYAYTKRLVHGESDVPLSNEEKIAVERAIEGNKSTDK